MRIIPSEQNEQEPPGVETAPQTPNELNPAASSLPPEELDLEKAPQNQGELNPPPLKDLSTPSLEKAKEQRVRLNPPQEASDTLDFIPLASSSPKLQEKPSGRGPMQTQGKSLGIE